MHKSKRTRNNSDDKDNKKFKYTTVPVYHGLFNEGATCYLNSVLQVFFMTDDFREAVESNTEEKYIDVQLKRLFTTLKENETNTKDVLSILGITNLHEQCDAAEYFERILSMVNPDASKIFKGGLRHSTTCFSKHVTSDETGPFWTLPLPIADPLDSSNTYCVKDGFNDFFKSSTVSGENQMYCDECDKKADATIECRMEHHPDILTLLLKRFEFDYYSMAYVKINRYVEVPHKLQTQDCDYELYAVVDHVGSLTGGHYTATIRSYEDHNWYVFDDTYVRLLNSDTFKQEDRFRSQNAYLIIYRKLVTPDCQINHGTDNRRSRSDSPTFTPSCSFEMETNKRKEDKNVQVNEAINQVNLLGGTEDAQKEDEVIGLKEQKGQIDVIGLKEQKSDNDGFGQNKQKEQTKIEYWSGENKVAVNVKESDDQNGLEEQKEQSEVVGQKDQEGEDDIVRQEGLKDVRQEQQKDDVRQKAQKENKVFGEKEHKGENDIVREEGNKEECEVVGQKEQEGEDDDVGQTEKKDDDDDTQNTQKEYDVLRKNTQTNKEEHYFVVTQEQQNVDKIVRQKELNRYDVFGAKEQKGPGEFVTQKKQREQEKIRQDGNKIKYDVNSTQNNVLENKTENDVVKRGMDVLVLKHNDERKRNVDGAAMAGRIKGDPEDNNMALIGRATLTRGNSGVAELGEDFDMTESDRTGNTSPSRKTDTPEYTTQCCFPIRRKGGKKTTKAENKRSGQWFRFWKWERKWKVKRRPWRLVNEEKRLMENIKKEDTKKIIEMGKREEKENKKKKEVEMVGTEENKGPRRKRVDSKSPFLTI